jgi:hypothetical protein
MRGCRKIRVRERFNTQLWLGMVKKKIWTTMTRDSHARGVFFIRVKINGQIIQKRVLPDMTLLHFERVLFG